MKITLKELEEKIIRLEEDSIRASSVIYSLRRRNAELIELLDEEAQLEAFKLSTVPTLNSVVIAAIEQSVKEASRSGIADTSIILKRWSEVANYTEHYTSQIRESKRRGKQNAIKLSTKESV